MNQYNMDSNKQKDSKKTKATKSSFSFTEISVKQAKNFTELKRILHFDLYFTVLHSDNTRGFHSYQEKKNRYENLTIEKFCDMRLWKGSKRSRTWLHLFDITGDEMMYLLSQFSNK